MITARHVNYYKDEEYYKKYKTSGQNFETVDRPDIHVSDAHPRYVASFDKSENQGFAGYIFQQRNDLYASSYTLWANTSSRSSEYGAFIYVGSGNYGSGVALGIGDSSGFSSSGTDVVLVIDGYNVVICGTKPEGWHHYGLVLEDDYTIHVYVDGQLFYTVNEYTSLYSQPYTFVIGNSGMPNEVYDNEGAWGNKIARVCVWNKTLSQSEIEEDYNANQTSPTFKEDGLYAYYSMCTEGDLLIDFGGKAGLQQDKMTWTYDSTSDKVNSGPAPAIVDGVIYPPSFSYNNTGWITGCYKVLDSFSPNGKPWEYVADFETPADLESYGEPFSAGIFGGIGTGDGCTPIYMQVSTDGRNKKLLTAFLSSNGTQWDISNQTVAEILIVEPNTRYRIKAVYDQTKYQWFRWNFTTEEWELQFTLNDSRPVYNGLAMQLGTNRGRNNGFGGNIYVKNCHIKVNDCYVWRGDMDGMGCDLTAFNSPEIIQEKWGNVPYVPNPIPQQYNNYYLTGTYTFTDGIFSKLGNATNTYMRSYNKVKLGDNFEIVVKARWNGVGSGLLNVGLNHGIQIQLSATDFKAYAGDQESTWDVYGQIIKSSLPSNTWFWAKVTYDGTDFNTYYSTDGTNYTLGGTSTATLDLSEDYIYIGCDTGFGSNGWGGDIDLTETYVKVDGEFAWKYIWTSDYPITLAKNMYYDYPLSVKNATMPIIEGKYRRLSCAEFDGTQYINLGYVPNDTSGMSIDGVSLVSNNIVWAGSRENSGDTRWSLGTNIVNTGTYTHYGWNTSGSMAVKTDVNQRITLRLNYKNNRKSEIIFYSLQKIAQGSKNLSGTLTTHTEPTYLGTWNQGGSASTSLMSSMLFYGMEITEDSDIVQNYIPVVRISDGKVGIYETISGQFLYPATGNDLIAHEVGYSVYGWDGIVWKEIMTDWPTYFASTANVVGTSIPNDGNFECGSNKYVVLKNTNIIPSVNTWEIMIKFKLATNQNLTGVLWGYNRGSGGTRHQNIQIYLGNSSLGMAISSNGSSWDYAQNSTTTTLQTNVWIYARMVFDGSKYVLSYSYDNETWEDILTYVSSTPIYGFYNTTLCAGDNGTIMGPAYLATVSLKECYLKIADEYVWRGNNLVIEPVEYPQTRISFDVDATYEYVNLLSWGQVEVECGYDDPDAETEVLQGTHTVVATSSDYDESEVEDNYYEVEND